MHAYMLHLKAEWRMHVEHQRNIAFTSSYDGAPSVAEYVPEVFSSSARRRNNPRVARIGAAPRLTRATPSFSSSGMEGDPGPARIFTGHCRSRTNWAMTWESRTPGTKTQSAPASR